MHARPLIFIPLLALALAGCATRSASTPPALLPADNRLDQQADLPAGTVAFDLYLPEQPGPRPLILVVHGFSRSKMHMTRWGEHLARQGFVVAVPTLPAWADHRRNANAIPQLITHLTQSHPDRIRPDHIGLVGFSAGGLATFLAAADDPRVRVWVGLDPVDRSGWAAAAAPRLRATPHLLLAEPSPCNANGNARSIAAALGPRAHTHLVPNATHTDPEWPTDPLAELACGKSDEARRQQFVRLTTDALTPMLRP